MSNSSGTIRAAASSRQLAGQARGKAGEDQALAYLVRHGLLLIERNFRCPRGEIDLIMRDGEEIVFVEVRMRGKSGFGGAAESITAKKQARLIFAAKVYLQSFRRMPVCRFDVIAFDGEQISWLKHAIEADA